MVMNLRFKENMAMNLSVDGRREERTMMPSFEYKKLNTKLKMHKAIQTTLRADQKAYTNSFSLKDIINFNTPIMYQKRVSLSGFSKRNSMLKAKRKQNQKIKASMTVEAALIFSLFLIAVINLMSVLEFVRLQSNMEAALHQVGKKLTIYGYAYDKTGLELEEYPFTSVLFSYSYIKSNVENYVGTEYLDKTVLKYGRNGIYYGNSKIMEEDTIDLVLLYEVSGLFSYDGIKGIPMFSRFYGHVWNGYDVEKQAGAEKEEETYVFITQTGTVYHRNRNCTYLNPSVEIIYCEDVKEKRNASGAIYHACEQCGSNAAGVVYITDYGNRYHTSLECSGLKRTVYSVPLSETGGRSPCSKCG